MKVDRPGKHFSSNLAGSPPPHGYYQNHSSPHLSFADQFSPSLGPGNSKLPPAPGIISTSASGLGPGLPPPPPTHGPYPSSSSNAPPPDDHSGALVPISAAPSSFPDDLDPSTVSPEFKKEGSDWFAVFNPKIKKGLDVNLVHTLMHERCV
jgi:glucose repression regulatory protein TUP1